MNFGTQQLCGLLAIIDIVVYGVVGFWLINPAAAFYSAVVLGLLALWAFYEAVKAGGGGEYVWPVILAVLLLYFLYHAQHTLHAI